MPLGQGPPPPRPSTLPPTAFTELIGCSLPIQQAAMGLIATPALAAAVARAGGLGMLAPTGMSAADAIAQVRDASAAAGGAGSIGAGFLVPFLDRVTFEAVAAEARLVECFYADPDAGLVASAHERGALVAWQVGSRDEAVAAADAGCDLVVVQGIEAGGHLRGSAPLLALLEASRAAVPVPIVAAGGIGSGRAIAAALLAGADAVRIGTRFVATVEAASHPDYVAALARATADDTVVTEAFSMGWPDAPHRVLRSAVEAADAPPGARSPLPPTRDLSGPIESAALYAGTSVDDVIGLSSTAVVLDELVSGAAGALATTRRP
jgi:NAD(P)H-dependent flavin oxidoreductase YrpB (nitropropane dioxygenase family)